jgi:hypothetical protein
LEKLPTTNSPSYISKKRYEPINVEFHLHLSK